MFSADMLWAAEDLLAGFRARSLRLALAESCTGGLVAALLTEIAGASDVLERGFVTYSNASKTELLGVPAGLIATHGAVSAEVAVAMAEGALRHSAAHVAVAVTGLAGPGGGAPGKPVGLVYIGAARTGRATLVEAFNFAPVSRAAVRLAAVRAALALARRAADTDTDTD